MKKIYLILSCLCFYVTSGLMAQINIGGTPKSFQVPLQEVLQPIVMPALDMTAIKQEDKADEEAGRPPRFGFRLETNLDMDNSGTWEELPNDEGRIWRLKIACPGARSINLLYDDFWLPEGATLYIYNQNKSHMIGGFTSKNNNSPRGESIGYATGLVFGDMITLEYFEPKEVEQTGRLSIAYVVHGYKTIDISDADTRAFGDSGNCQINVNCTAGSSWQNEKTSVALILVGGNRWCTGSLLNNGYGDFLPYFLTAHHCLDGWAVPTALDAASNPNGSTWSFYWNYESATCANPITEPGFTSTTGAILVANKSDSDFALFRLTEDPYRDAGLILSYNGWDAGNSPPAGGAGIHHPSGDIKKISLFQQTPFDDHSCAPANTWSVIFQHSASVYTTTEGGSSGSPLYDNNHRVIGQLWGGRDPNDCTGGPTCSDPANDMSYYGKFSTSWGDSDGAQRRLSDWLSPTCHVNYAVPSNTTIGAPVYYASEQLSSNRAISGTVTDVVFNGGEEVVMTEGFSVSGGAEFRATNTNCDPGVLALKGDESNLPHRGSMVIPTEYGTKLVAGNGEILSEEFFVENRADENAIENFTKGSLVSQPNPFKGSTTLLFTLEQPSQVQLQLFDLTGTLMKTLVNTNYSSAGDYSVEMESSTLAAGQYWAVLQTANKKEVVKLVLIK